jgi:hypothetical protein
MEITEALKKTDDDKEVKDRLKGKYLCSALSFLNGWIINVWELNFYDKATNKITQVSVDETAHIKGEGEPFKDEEIPEIDASKIKISATKALAIGKKHYDEKYKSREVQRIFFALHGGKKPYWSISVITKYLTMIIMNIDTKDGSVTKSEECTILNKNKSAF